MTTKAPTQTPLSTELSPEEALRLDQEHTSNKELEEAQGLVRLTVLEKLSRVTDDPILKSATAKVVARLKAIQSGQPATDFYKEAA